MDIPKLVDSLAALAWPLIAALVLWRIFPHLRAVLASRNFKIKIGEMELSVQEASEQLRAQIEDLQTKVAELRLGAPGPAAPAPAAALQAAPPPADVPRRLLWVDDEPADNAYEIARLRDDDVDVVEVTSTDEALRLLVSKREPFRAVITDMGRREEGSFRPRAGISLIEELRSVGLTVPVFVYTSARSLERARQEVLAAGGNGATASAVELFELVRELL